MHILGGKCKGREQQYIIINLCSSDCPQTLFKSYDRVKKTRVSRCPVHHRLQESCEALCFKESRKQLVFVWRGRRQADPLSALFINLIRGPLSYIHFKFQQFFFIIVVFVMLHVNERKLKA